MIDAHEFTKLLLDLIDVDSAAHSKWAALNERVPIQVKEALRLCPHMVVLPERMSANDQGGMLAAALGGSRMRDMYHKSVGMRCEQREVFAFGLSNAEGIEPALAAAYLLVCSPINAHATMRRLAPEKYDPHSLGPRGPVASSTPEG